MNLEKIIMALKRFTLSTMPFSETMNYFISTIAENSKALAQFNLMKEMCAFYFFTDINIGMVMLSSFDGENDFYRIDHPQIFVRDKPPIILSKANHTIH